MSGKSGGAIVAENRDYRPEHSPIRRAIAHVDTAWNGRSILAPGSLGSPGNFSSGMTSDGLAVAERARRTTDLGPGLHRYLSLTCLAAALHDHFFWGRTRIWERGLLLAAAFVLIQPGLLTDTIGATLVGLAVASQLLIKPAIPVLSDVERTPGE